MTAPPELRALSPPHPSEDCFWQKTPPRPSQLPRDEARSRGVGRDTCLRYPEDQCQVDFSTLFCV